MKNSEKSFYKKKSSYTKTECCYLETKKKVGRKLLSLFKIVCMDLHSFTDLKQAHTTCSGKNGLSVGRPAAMSVTYCKLGLSVFFLLSVLRVFFFNNILQYRPLWVWWYCGPSRCRTQDSASKWKPTESHFSLWPRRWIWGLNVSKWLHKQ